MDTDSLNILCNIIEYKPVLQTKGSFSNEKHGTKLVLITLFRTTMTWQLYDLSICLKPDERKNISITTKKKSISKES